MALVMSSTIGENYGACTVELRRAQGQPGGGRRLVRL